MGIKILISVTWNLIISDNTIKAACTDHHRSHEKGTRHPHVCTSTQFTWLQPESVRCTKTSSGNRGLHAYHHNRDNTPVLTTWVDRRGCKFVRASPPRVVEACISSVAVRPTRCCCCCGLRLTNLHLALSIIARYCYHHCLQNPQPPELINARGEGC